MLKHRLSLVTGLFVLVVIVLVTHTGWADEATSSVHRSLQGIIVEKAGSPAVKVPDGTVYLLNKNKALRHGHALPQVGEEVTVILNRKTNAVLEVHPKGTKVESSVYNRRCGFSRTPAGNHYLENARRRTVFPPGKTRNVGFGSRRRDRDGGNQ